MIDDLLILNISVDIFNIYVHLENPQIGEYPDSDYPAIPFVFKIQPIYA